MPPTLERRRITFQGRVQGVGFRATTRVVAQSHAVTGWVRNERDGSVLVEVQGPAAAIESFLTDLRARMARNIRHESSTTIPPLESEQGFDIQY